MSVEFVNSETCKIDGKEMSFLKDSVSLLNQIEKTLKEVGPEKFFSSTDQNIKRVRESMAGFFFMSGMNKLTKRHWWLMQPNDTFPDFIFMAVNDNPLTISLEQCELVEIPSRCQTFEEMKAIVKSKLNKGYPEGSHLLIFVNHEKSEEWIQLLHNQLENYHPFKAIWTVHLLFRNKNNPITSVVNKIKPDPTQRVEAMFDDPQLYQSNLPNFMERIEKDGKVFVQFRPDFAGEFIKQLRKQKLANK